MALALYGKIDLMGVTQQARMVYADLAGAARLAADVHSFLRLSVDFLLARVMRVVQIPLSGRLRGVRLRGGITLFYRLDRADIYTIHEVWIEEIYRLPSNMQPKVMIDLGANIGLTSLWLAKRYGASRVIAVEPSTLNAHIARINLEANNIHADVLEAAVGAEDGTVLFDQGPGATNGRVVDYDDPSKKGSSTPAQTAIKMVSMATILKLLPEDATVDLLKVDIEGGEENLLSGDVRWLTRVKSLQAEFHPALIDYQRVKKTILDSGLHCVQQDTIHENTLEIFVR